MKKTLLLPLAALAFGALFATAACNNENGAVSSTDTIKQGPLNPAAAADMPVVASNAGEEALPATPLSTTEEYMDLNTGKNTRIKQKEGGTGYTAETGGDLNLLVNTATRDTFWGPTGQLVNGYVLHQGTRWNVDDMKLKRDGDGFKLKSADGEQKIKSNDNELKIKDGDEKLKANDNEVKYKNKEEDIKIKSNGKETKIKTKDEKTIIDRDGKVTTKPR